MERSNLWLVLGALAILAAGTGVIYMSDWKRRAALMNPDAESLIAMLNALEVQYGIPHDLLARQAYKESSFDPDVISGAKRSSAGAMGLMQFMPATAAQFGLTNPFDPQASANAGAQYMAALYSQFGSWSLALAAYNAGPGNVQKYGGIPPFPETQDYVSSIIGDVNAEGGPQVA